MTDATGTVPRRRTAVLGLALACSLAAAPAAAQGTPPSPYLPLDDVAYTFLDALQSRGRLRPLPVLERPYTVAQVRQALAAADTAAWHAVERGWARRAREAMAKYEAGDAGVGEMALHVNVGLLATGSTSGTRDLMVADTALGISPGGQVRATVRTGPLVAAFRARWDQSLRANPEYTGFGGGSPIASRGHPVIWRAEEGYASVQLPFAEVFGGRLARNWGPPAYEGLLLGSAPWSYDHVAARLGGRRFRLTWLAARLNDFPTGDSLVKVNRYLSARRAAVRLGNVEVGMSESVVWSGVGRGLSWALASPFIPTVDGLYNRREGGNNNYAIDAAWQGPVGRWTGQLYVDDIQLDGTTRKPPMYGATVAADGLPLAGAHRWFLGYTEVSAYVYRNTTAADAYTDEYVALGRAGSDYREGRLGLDLAVAPDAVVRPYVAIRAQGTGTYRNPYPPASQWAGLRAILEGHVMSVGRVAVQGAWRARAFEVAYDLGINRVHAMHHVPGHRHTGVEGRIRVQWEPPAFGRRLVFRDDDPSP